jgi:hypothetical protein
VERARKATETEEEKPRKATEQQDEKAPKAVARARKVDERDADKAQKDLDPELDKVQEGRGVAAREGRGDSRRAQASTGRTRNERARTFAQACATL